jgi:hypothetical protein
MLKLSHTTKRTALAALLTAGLAGSAAVTLVPAPSHAQSYRDYDDHYRGDDGGRYYRDRDRDYYRDGYNNQYRADWDGRYHRYWNGRAWVGIGVPGFGIGVYDYPYYNNGYAGPYCDAYGYCTY